MQNGQRLEDYCLHSLNCKHQHRQRHGTYTGGTPQVVCWTYYGPNNATMQLNLQIFWILNGRRISQPVTTLRCGVRILQCFTTPCGVTRDMMPVQPLLHRFMAQPGLFPLNLPTRKMKLWICSVCGVGLWLGDVFFN
eukprot:PhF_6_TR17050/c0_g1_i1/m.25989